MSFDWVIHKQLVHPGISLHNKTKQTTNPNKDVKRCITFKERPDTRGTMLWEMSDKQLTMTGVGEKHCLEWWKNEMGRWWKHHINYGDGIPRYVD
jgi:hypothetical protein